MDELVIRFRLIGDEATALRKLARVECRTAIEQTRYLLQQELVRRGLLETHSRESRGNGGQQDPSREGQA